MRKDEANQTRAEDRIITLQEAAVMLNSSYSTVLRMVASGELPAFRIRHAWRTSTVMVEEFIVKRVKENALMARSVLVED